MEKEFIKNKDGSMNVKMIDDGELILPINGKNENIGKYVQKTEQQIPKDKIKVLESYLQNQKDEAEKEDVQIDTLLKRTETVDEKAIPEKVIDECMKTIQKGSKAFRTSMQGLSKAIQAIKAKKALIQKKEHVRVQLEAINKDYDALKKALKQ